MKILFIASWFPSRVHATDGNFVEKHARLVAQQQEVVVLHAQHDPMLAPSVTELVKEQYSGFVVFTLYYGLKANPSAWQKRKARCMAYRRLWQAQYQQWGLPDILHAHVLFDAGIFGAVWSRYFRLPLLITEHSSIYYHPRRLRWYHRLLARCAARQALFLMPVSHHLQQAMQTVGLRGPWQIVPNAVDTAIFRPLPAPSSPPFRWLHISNFDPRVKNTTGILRAFAQLRQQHPEATLTIAGDGDLAPLQAIAQECGLVSPHLHLLGTQTETEVAHLFQTHHAFVLFSNYETQSVVLLEAQCCGLPLVATQVGGIPEIITSPSQGLLLPPGDAAALVQAMHTLQQQYAIYDHTAIAHQAHQQYSEATVQQLLAHCYRLCHT